MIKINSINLSFSFDRSLIYILLSIMGFSCLNRGYIVIEPVNNEFGMSIKPTIVILRSESDSMVPLNDTDKHIYGYSLICSNNYKDIYKLIFNSKKESGKKDAINKGATICKYYIKDGVKKEEVIFQSKSESISLFSLLLSNLSSEKCNEQLIFELTDFIKLYREVPDPL